MNFVINVAINMKSRMVFIMELSALAMGFEHLYQSAFLWLYIYCYQKRHITIIVFNYQNFCPHAIMIQNN